MQVPVWERHTVLCLNTALVPGVQVQLLHTDDPGGLDALLGHATGAEFPMQYELAVHRVQDPMPLSKYPATHTHADWVVTPAGELEWSWQATGDGDPDVQ